MAHRLPIPGSDNGTWGDILNDFLLQAHNSDGSLSAIAPSKITPGSNTQVLTTTSGTATWGPAPVPSGVVANDTLVINVKDHGALGDNSANDTSAVIAAVAAFTSRGGILYFPPGVYLVNASIAIPSNIRVVGAGKSSSIVKKTANIANGLFDFSGTDTNTRCQRGGMMDIQLNGGTTFTGPLIRTQYADHLNFDRVYCNLNGDIAVYALELWDSFFNECEFEWCGTSTFKTGAVVRVLGSATASSNQIHFNDCRWESFSGNALFLDSNGTPASSPYGIYLNDAKMESNSSSANLSWIDTTNDVSDVHIKNIYFALDSGSTSTAASFIDASGNANWIIEGVRATTAHTFYCVIYIFSGSPGHAIRDVFVSGPSKPTNGIISFGGGSQIMRIENVRYADGSIANVYNGTKPVGVTLVDLPTGIYQDTGSLGLGAHYLNLPNTSGAYASTPSSVAWAPQSINQPIDLRVKAALVNWVPSGNNFLVANFNAAADSRFALYIDNAGKVNIVIYRTGSVFTGAASSIATGVTANATSWVRGVIYPVSGVAIFYLSSDGVTWTQLGTTQAVTAGAVQTPGTAQPLTVGATAAGTGFISGKIFASQVIIGGGTMSAIDFSQQAASSTSFTAITGETWTVQGTASII